MHWSEPLLRGSLDSDVSAQAVAVVSGVRGLRFGTAAAGTDSRGRAGKVATNLPPKGLGEKWR